MLSVEAEDLRIYFCPISLSLNASTASEWSLHGWRSAAAGLASLAPAAAEAADGGDEKGATACLQHRTHRKELDSSPVLRHVHESPRVGLNACVLLAERPHGDQRVAGRSSQRGGYPLLQPFPGPEPGAPHAAHHNHPQHLLLQTLSHNGNDPGRKLWKLEI